MGQNHPDRTRDRHYVYSDSTGHFLFHLPAAAWQVQPFCADHIAVPPFRSVTVPPNRSGVDFQMIQAHEIYLPLIYRMSG